MFNPIHVYDPQSLFLEIRKRCNAYCDHCGNGSGPDNDSELEDETISTVLQDAGRNGFITITIGGGEPFLDVEKLKHTIKEGVRNGLIPEFINTNAYFAESVDEAKDALNELKNVGFGEKYYVKAKKIKKRRFLRYGDGNRNIEVRSGGLGISFDKFHQPFVPTQNIANLIKAYQEVFGNTEELELHYVFGRNYQLNGKDVIEFLNALSELGFDIEEGYKNRKTDAFHEIMNDKKNEKPESIDPEENQKKLRLKSGDIYIMESTANPTGRAKNNLKFDLVNIPDEVFKNSNYCCGLIDEGPQEMGITSDGDAYAHAGFLCRSKGLYLGNIYKRSFKNLIEQGKHSLIVDAISLDGAYMLRRLMKKAGIGTNIKSESLCHFCYQALSDEKTIDKLNTYYSGHGRAKMIGYDLKKLRLRLHGMGMG